MPLYDLTGTTTGAGDLPTSTPVKVVVTAGSVVGVSGVSTEAQRTMIFGAQAYGFGGVEDHLTLYTAGSTVGQGFVTGFLVRRSPMYGQTIGASRFFESYPQPMIGRGFITGIVVVDRIPCPVSCPLVASPKSFRWGYTFTRCDLTLQLREPGGNPFSPIIVLYRMFRALPGGALQPVGPFNRIPVRDGVGDYYVTGTAGELGQPGDWVIEWRWQRSTFSPTQVERFPFRVLDAVAAGDTCLCRTTKYGWNE